MKKILSILSLVSLCAVSSQADFLRIEAGAGAWMDKGNGSARYTKNSDITDFTGTYTTDGNDQTDFYVWALFKHPIPLIPNARVEYSTLTDEGKARGSIDGFRPFLKAPTTVDMKEIDLIPYYNLLDNTMWITVDLGIDLKYIMTDSTIKSLIPSNPFFNPSYSNSNDFWIPLVYIRGRVQIPETGLGVESDIKYITDGDSTIYDIRIKADYTFNGFASVKPGLEVGYRIQKYDIDSDNVISNIDYSGLYVGAMLKF